MLTLDILISADESGQESISGLGSYRLTVSSRLTSGIPKHPKTRNLANIWTVFSKMQAFNYMHRVLECVNTPKLNVTFVVSLPCQWLYCRWLMFDCALY